MISLTMFGSQTLGLELTCTFLFYILSEATNVTGCSIVDMNIGKNDPPYLLVLSYLG